MRFYTKQECEEWLSGRKRQKPDAVPSSHFERILFPSEPHRYYWVAQWVASSLMYRRPALLWVTEWDIWGSTENLHLYYKLRQAYGDHRLLQEAPGHLFLPYEAEELASFLQVGMLNGWGGYLLTDANYVNAFFSHDGYFNFYSESGLHDVRQNLGPEKSSTEP